MNDINKVVISGRLTRDAELKYTQGGFAHLFFSIASNYSIKQGDSWVEKANFFDCDLWGKRAEALHQYMTKGQQVFVSGELRHQTWESDGQKKSRVSINVEDVILASSKSGRGDTQNGSDESKPAQGSPDRSQSDSNRLSRGARQPARPAPGAEDMFEDDDPIPF